MIDYEPVNCPNCGKFLKWNYEKDRYVCSCKQVGTFINREIGMVTVFKIEEPEIHEVRSLHRKVRE